MLFNYNNDDIKIVLFNNFPANVCNKICDYIVPQKCTWLLEKETEFMKNNLPKHLSKSELQILFMKICKPPPITLYKYNFIDNKNMKKQIDVMLENENDDRLTLQAMKSYTKNNLKLVHLILLHCHDIEKMKQLCNHSQFPKGTAYYSFRNKSFHVGTLVELFVKKYLTKLFGIELDYCRLDLGSFCSCLLNC